MPYGLPSRGSSQVSFASSVTQAAAQAQVPIVGTATQVPVITGFEVTGLGATAASTITVAVAITGIGTLSYALTIPAGVTTAITPLLIEYATPIEGTMGQAITVTVPSAGAGNTNVTLAVHGFLI